MKKIITILIWLTALSVAAVAAMHPDTQAVNVNAAIVWGLSVIYLVAAADVHFISIDADIDNYDEQAFKQAITWHKHYSKRPNIWKFFRPVLAIALAALTIVADNTFVAIVFLILIFTFFSKIKKLAEKGRIIGSYYEISDSGEIEPIKHWNKRQMLDDCSINPNHQKWQTSNVGRNVSATSQPKSDTIDPLNPLNPISPLNPLNPLNPMHLHSVSDHSECVARMSSSDHCSSGSSYSSSSYSSSND